MKNTLRVRLCQFIFFAFSADLILFHNFFKSSSLSTSTPAKTWGCLRIIFLLIPAITSSILKWLDSSFILARSTRRKRRSPVSSQRWAGSFSSIASSSSLHSSEIYFFNVSWVCFLSQGQPFSERNVATVWQKEKKYFCRCP